MSSSHAAVRRHVGDRLPRQALEVLAHHRDAFGRPVGLLVVDGRHPRVELLEHVVARRARPRPAGPDRKVGRASAAGRCRPPPSAAARGCARPGRAGSCRNVVPARNMPIDDERRLDALVGHLGVAARPSRRPAAGSTRLATMRALHRHLAELVELRLARRPTRSKTASPSRKSSGPKSSRPVCSHASARTVVGAARASVIAAERRGRRRSGRCVRRCSWSSSAAATSPKRDAPPDDRTDRARGDELAAARRAPRRRRSGGIGMTPNCAHSSGDARM